MKTGQNGGHGAGTETIVDVAIAGADPAALLAGYLLVKAGLSVALIERQFLPEFGGARDRAWDDAALARAGGTVSSGSPVVAELCRALAPHVPLVRLPAPRGLYRGAIYADPPRRRELLRHLGPGYALRSLASWLSARLAPRQDAHTIEDREVNRRGQALHRVFTRTRAEKLWGMPCDAIVAAGPSSPPSSSPARSHFAVPDQVWRAARQQFVACGGQFLTGHAPRRFSHDSDAANAPGWRVVTAHPSGAATVLAHQVISTLPLRELAARLHPLARSTSEAFDLKYRDLITVVLHIGSDALLSETALAAVDLVVHDRSVKVSRLRRSSDGARICLDYYCAERGSLWALPDSVLKALATRDLVTLGLYGAEDVTGGSVVRQEKACPVPDERHAANVAAIHGEIAALYPTLHLLGRTAVHRNLEFDQVIEAAVAMVATIVAPGRAGQSAPAPLDAAQRAA